MEAVVKKYQQKYRKVKDEMGSWEELQSRLLSQFSNASSIVQRFQVIHKSRNYGGLKCVEGIEGAVLAKQMESLQTILLSMNKTLEDFHGVVLSIEKIVRDSRQLVKGGSAQLTTKQLKQQIGVKPSVADCLDGLRLLEEMHQSEYHLKLSVVSALPELALKLSGGDGDLDALRQLLVDQPNIPREEGLKNGILDQSAILLSAYGCLTYMDCKTKEHKVIRPPDLEDFQKEMKNKYKILLAFSGLKQALTSNPGYNNRVNECRDAARVLLKATGNDGVEPLLSNVKLEEYEKHKCELTQTLAKRAEHYFSENERVRKGVEAWASGNMEEFGKLVTASGLSSIKNYECGCEPLIHIYNILLKAPGVYGARFSGAGFRGCCIAFVDADKAVKAKSYIKNEYSKFQPELASQMNAETVLICDAGDCARVI